MSLSVSRLSATRTVWFLKPPGLQGLLSQRMVSQEARPETSMHSPPDVPLPRASHPLPCYVSDNYPNNPLRKPSSLRTASDNGSRLPLRRCSLRTRCTTPLARRVKAMAEVGMPCYQMEWKSMYGRRYCGCSVRRERAMRLWGDTSSLVSGDNLYYVCNTDWITLFANAQSEGRRKV